MEQYFHPIQSKLIIYTDSILDFMWACNFPPKIKFTFNCRYSLKEDSENSLKV